MNKKTICKRCGEQVDRGDSNINLTTFTIKPNHGKGETTNQRGYLCDNCSLKFSIFLLEVRAGKVSK